MGHFPVACGRLEWPDEHTGQEGGHSEQVSGRSEVICITHWKVTMSWSLVVWLDGPISTVALSTAGKAIYVMKLGYETENYQQQSNRPIAFLTDLLLFEQISKRSQRSYGRAAGMWTHIEMQNRIIVDACSENDVSIQLLYHSADTSMALK